jgi:predicted O-methyltransferase YrrM
MVTVDYNLNELKYDKTWFLNSELKKQILKYLDTNKKYNILEIGCFEGLSTVFLANNLLKHNDSTMIAIDPLIPYKDLMTETHKNNFFYNLEKCTYRNKITFYEITSDEYFEKFINNDTKFNFIYIDGNHDIDFIYRDMENSFKFLEKRGIMWMDDYRGGNNDDIKNTMDRFINQHKSECRIVHKGYQLALMKL